MVEFEQIQIGSNEALRAEATCEPVTRGILCETLDRYGQQRICERMGLGQPRDPSILLTST